VRADYNQKWFGNQSTHNSANDHPRRLKIMKTSIEVDNSLVINALTATGLATQQEVVELALKLLIQMKHQETLKSLRGQLAWDGDLDSLRTDS
jgi:Arc/MetJ family transcription regulator